MFQKLKNKLKYWLFSEEIKQLNECLNQTHNIANSQLMSLEKLSRATDHLTEASNKYHNAFALSQQAYKMVSEIVDVGVDVHHRHDDNHSWAVVCIQGKPEYVKFVPLNNKDTRDIIEFLRHFGYSNKVIDSPFNFKILIDDWKL